MLSVKKVLPQCQPIEADKAKGAAHPSKLQVATKFVTQEFGLTHEHSVGPILGQSPLVVSMLANAATAAWKTA